MNTQIRQMSKPTSSHTPKPISTVKETVPRKSTIYCCYHSDNQLKNYKKDDKFKWINLSLNPLHPYLCEFIGYKYILENDIDSDIIGICHYRRQFNIFDPALVDDKNCIAFHKDHLYSVGTKCNASAKDFCKNYMYCDFAYDLWKEYIENNSEYNYLLQYDNSKADNCFVGRSSVILDRNHFIDLAKYIMGYFEFIDEKFMLEHNINNYFDITRFWYKTYGTYAMYKLSWFKYGREFLRLFAYIGEILVSNYILANFDYDNIHILDGNTVIRQN